jgi:hypothetical protein
VTPRARDLVLDLFLYGLSALFALVTALSSTLLPHRAWGAMAAWAYLGAFVLAGIQLVVRQLGFSGRLGGVPGSRAESSGEPAAPASAAAARSAEGASQLAAAGAQLAGVSGRLALTWVAWVGAALVPLVVEAVQRAGGRADRAQDEVLVVERMGGRLLHTGTPYLGHDAIAALPAGDRLLGYSPYEPGMAVFGLPRALAGDAWITDARVWFALVTAVALGGAARALFRVRKRSTTRAIQAATVLPICALTLATGGDDMPVLALCLVGLAWCAVGRFGAAGVAVGAAAAMKPFAFPVLAVLIVLVIVTDRDRARSDGIRRARDRGGAGQLPTAGEAELRMSSSGPGLGGWVLSGRSRRFLIGAVGLPIVALLPALLVDGDALLENVVRFPLGHGVVTSPAQSPFPGYLISTALPGGRFIAAALLVAAAVVIAVMLVRRPPHTAATAALYCGWGLLCAILLMPTTRFGYLLYPVSLLVMAPALRRPTGSTAPRGEVALYGG